MNHRMGITALALGTLAFLATAPQLRAQQTPSQSQSQKQSQQPAQQNQKPSGQPGAAAQQAPGTSAANPTAPPKVDPKEEAAYKAIYDMKPSTPADFAKEIRSGEAFEKSYPNSRYLASVYSRLTNAYFETRNLDKMFEYGDKTLKLQPNDVSVLTLLGWVIPRAEASAPDFAQQLVKAEQYEKLALQLLPTMTKPAEVTEEQFAKTKGISTSMAHSGLGLIYFRQGKAAESAAELQLATQGAADPDPTDFFILALDLENQQKYADAAKAFDTCAQISSSLQDRCKQGAKQAKAKAATQLQPPK